MTTDYRRRLEDMLRGIEKIKAKKDPSFISEKGGRASISKEGRETPLFNLILGCFVVTVTLLIT